MSHLAQAGYKVTLTPTDPAAASRHAGWAVYRVEVRGADHEGIVHDVARGLSEAGINIESMETGVTEAPLSGTPLFTMTAVVAVPPGLDRARWTADLQEAARLANVDVEATPVGLP